MATTTAKTPKKLTRADRESARKAAASANASMDLARVGRAVLVVVVVSVMVLSVLLFVPRAKPLGGPLQASRLEGAATLGVVAKTKERAVTFGLAVPWNTGSGIVELEELVPIGADGVEMLQALVVPFGASPVATSKGFPPDTGVLVPLENFPVPPGTNDVDGFQIVVGLKGAGMVPAFALTYRVGGVHHVAILGHGVMLCSKACDGQEVAEAGQRAFLAGLSAFVEVPAR